MRHQNCPACGITWNGQDIFEYFMEQATNPDAPQHHYYQGYTEEEILTVAGAYGYTRENPRYFAINVLAIVDPNKYDGIIYWHCTSCKTSFDRFTGAPVNLSL